MYLSFYRHFVILSNFSLLCHFIALCHYLDKQRFCHFSEHNERTPRAPLHAAGLRPGVSRGLREDARRCFGMVYGQGFTVLFIWTIGRGERMGIEMYMEYIVCSQLGKILWSVQEEYLITVRNIVKRLLDRWLLNNIYTSKRLRRFLRHKSHCLFKDRLWIMKSILSSQSTKTLTHYGFGEIVKFVQ